MLINPLNKFLFKYFYNAYYKKIIFITRIKMLPKWIKKYSVNNAKIDDQHKKLFQLAAKVEAISEKSVSRNDIKDLLSEFFNYMKDHFSDEEKYMQLIDYPDLEEHRKIHKVIIQDMIKAIKNIKSTNDLKEKLYTITKQWLLEHILCEDMKVKQWRNSLLATDNNKDVDFKVEDKENKLPQFYLYTCGCLGKFHDVPCNIHQEIISQGHNFTCKICKQSIKFYKEYS